MVAKRQLWTEKEIELLKETYPITTWKGICEYFPNRKFDGIEWKALQLGLRKEKRNA